MTQLRYTETRTAGAALSARRFVKLSGGALVPCVDGDAVHGVSELDADSGSPAPAAIWGIMEVESAIALVAGDEVSSNADARAKAPATGNAIVGKVIVGCQGPSGGAFDVAKIALYGNQPTSA